jgi:tRNA A-37 threonylcarbamoyl transferase component Bud32
MIKSKTATSRSYTAYLGKIKMKFTDEKGWLFVGEPNFNENWIVYISALTLQSKKILAEVIPLLKTWKVPFRLIRDDDHGYYLNSGVMQVAEVGKFISIYTSSVVQAQEIIAQLRPLLQDYLGPQVPDAIRIDKNIYAQFAFVEKAAKNSAGKIHLTIPSAKQIPFDIPSLYKRQKTKKIIGKYYLKMKTLRSGPKGEVMLAYSFKQLPFKSVVIKEGRHGTIEDPQGRDIRDRLLWQKQILPAISSHIPTAKLLDYFEQDHNNYLVMEYLDGKFLAEKLRQIKKHQPWKDLHTKSRIRILGYYLQIIRIIQQLHAIGYVHRDIQDNNFIINDRDKVFIIDFELAYNYFRDIPQPAWLLGTIGYMSPEQMGSQKPAPAADIYSLGSLLAFLLTGEHPATLPGDPTEQKAILRACTNDEKMVALAMACLSQEPALRPAITNIETAILNAIHLKK